MLTEAEGCAILKRVFGTRGYKIDENVHFHEEDVSFNADGWDAVARVGYEFLTHDAGDHDDLTPEELKTLDGWMEADRVYFFIIDEKDVGTADDLEWAANRFLDEVDRRRAARRTP